MAANYKVNIELDTKKLDAQLKRLKKQVGEVGKIKRVGGGRGRSGSGSEGAILELPDQIRIRNFAKSINPILNKAEKVTKSVSQLALPSSEMLEQRKLADIVAKQTERKAKAEQRSAEFAKEAMKSNQASAKAGAAHAKKLERMRKDTGFTAAQYGPQFDSMSLPTESALNFDRRTGRLLRGPAGSSPNTFRNLGRRFDTQSALISGAFPLLFGQGPVTAAAGALGGGIGGMFGQMGGFAGGIAATAIVGGIQQQIAAVAELGQAFNSVTPNIQALTGALGIAGTEEEKRLQLIQKQQGSQAALSAVTQKMNELIGENGVKSLKDFGDNTRLLSNAFAEAMTKFKAALAPLLNMLAKPFTGQLSRKEQERLAGVGGAATDETLLDLEEELGGVRSTKQNRAKRNRIKARIADRKEELALFGQSIERANNLKLIENDIVRKNRQKNELLQATIDGNKEQVQLSQDIAAEVQRRLDAGFAIMEIDVKDIENQIKKTNELEKQAEIAEQIEQSFKDMVGTIATDLSDGIKGLIRGTSTLNEVMNNVLDKMIDAAFNMAFFGNASGTLTKGLGLFGNLFGGFLSTGGPARAGKSYIVGERGPELFTPGISGMVSPNSSLGGSTNIVVNVDASGSNVEGDEQQSRELGRLISVAVQSEILQQKRPGGLLA